MLYKHIGKAIRFLRLEKELTQEKLAEASDISISFLGHIERGTRKLSVETLYKLTQALDCSADELLGTGIACKQEDRAIFLLQNALLVLQAQNETE